MVLVGCDTFVVLSDATSSKDVIFGKNADRPYNEVQEVVYFPGEEHPDGASLKCTYIEIPQVQRTLSVILSKPAWMWGAEMGANEAGVAIGNEAVWDRLISRENDLVPRLLGMDLVRLALERAATAEEALNVLIALLEAHGQGGECFETFAQFSYHNSFLIADSHEAWVLETADRLWAAERVTNGYRNISNCMSITTRMDRCSDDLKSRAKAEGWWDGQTEFNWTEIIGESLSDLADTHSRWYCGNKLLKKKSSENSFDVKDMMAVLRDERSGINMSYGGGFLTTGSQVSALCESGGVSCCHWFTATAKPSKSIFKPFIFSQHLFSDLRTRSPVPVDISVEPSSRAHELWSAQTRTSFLGREQLRPLEDKYIDLAEKERVKTAGDRHALFDEAVADELLLYT